MIHSKFYPGGIPHEKDGAARRTFQALRKRYYVRRYFLLFFFHAWNCTVLNGCAIFLSNSLLSINQSINQSIKFILSFLPSFVFCFFFFFTLVG